MFHAASPWTTAHARSRRSCTGLRRNVSRRNTSLAASAYYVTSCIFGTPLISDLQRAGCLYAVAAMPSPGSRAGVLPEPARSACVPCTRHPKRLAARTVSTGFCGQVSQEASKRQSAPGYDAQPFAHTHVVFCPTRRIAGERGSMDRGRSALQHLAGPACTCVRHPRRTSRATSKLPSRGMYRSNRRDRRAIESSSALEGASSRPSQLETRSSKAPASIARLPALMRDPIVLELLVATPWSSYVRPLGPTCACSSIAYAQLYNHS